MGGFVIAMGSQIFILPYLDSIGGFTILFVVVTAFAFWQSLEEWLAPLERTVRTYDVHKPQTQAAIRLRTFFPCIAESKT